MALPLAVRRRRLDAACAETPIPHAQSTYTRALPRTTVNIQTGTIIQAATAANDSRQLRQLGPDFGGIAGLEGVLATRRRAYTGGITMDYNLRLNRPVALYSVRLVDFDCTDPVNGGCRNGCGSGTGTRVGETAYNVWPPVTGAVNFSNAGDLVTRKNNAQSRPAVAVYGFEQLLFGDTLTSNAQNKVPARGAAPGSAGAGFRAFWYKANGCEGFADLQFGGRWSRGFQADISLPSGLGGGYSIMEFGAEDPNTPCTPYLTDAGAWVWRDSRTGVALTAAQIATIVPRGDA